MKLSNFYKLLIIQSIIANILRGIVKMTKKKMSIYYVVIILFSTLFIFSGCNEEHEGINTPNTTEEFGNIKLSFHKTNSTNSQVSTVTAFLTRSGFESFQSDMTVGNGEATDTIFNVAEGNWQLSVQAKDSAGTVIYRGRADVEIINNQTTYVAIELSPASTTGDLSIYVSWAQGDGINWTKDASNPVLQIGSSGSWDDDVIADPTVLFDGEIYKMWYSGSDGSNYRIGYATSEDGVNWTKYSGNPVLNLGLSGSWDDADVERPVVLFDGLNYKMWFSASDGSTNSIGYATSQDGITWTKYSGNPVMNVGTSGSWDDNDIYGPSVIYEDHMFKMWYLGNNSSSYAIGYATSQDGINWSKYSGNPVLSAGSSGSWDDIFVANPSVIFDGTTYKMWYEGFGGSARIIGYASSSDGTSWTKHAENPVLSNGSSGSWDELMVISPSVLFNGGTYKIWFMGANSTAKGIGLAVSP